MVKKSDYGVKKSIMMQKLGLGTASLQPTKIEHVDRVNVVDYENCFSLKVNNRYKK